MVIRKPFRAANPGSKMPPDRLRFFEAARHNHVSVVREYLETYDDAIMWRLRDKTALFIAVEHGSFISVQLLLDYGAQPAENQGVVDTTPLHAAAQTDHADILGLLLHHRAPVDTLRRDKNTPLMEAVYWDSRKAAGALLRRGASMEKKNAEGDAPLHIAVERDYPLSVALLLDHGAEINAPNDKGLTPLMIAADNGRLDAARVLLARGADQHVTTAGGKTALDFGVAHGDNDPEFVEGFRDLINARNRKDAATMGIPFTEGTERTLKVRKPIRLRHRRPRP
jgi:ankyrin repeat protein